MSAAWFFRSCDWTVDIDSQSPSSPRPDDKQPHDPRQLTIMSAAPLFWSTPLKYCRWAARERPALFWSVIIGAAGPVAMPIVPPIRHYFGDIDAPPVPVTYPIPSGPRKQLTGYDD
ncbi:hypothetical protein BKA59DRAFT_521523 [Fusarium tricinctum]|uniref:NADH dehydrogenase n=2 Tax=Fusarium tricinctum species complex TaxID=679429 RepID=A0A8K0WFZ3_9HYPO|nr:hypothetical protein BKA59DRAFT_521523 [Fusarium tricinctum]